MNNERERMSKRELVQEISHVTQLKRDVVDSVLNAFSDIFIRESVMTGEFLMPNCFSVKTHTRSARRQYNVQKEEFFNYPETKVLSITLSKKIKGFHRWKQRHEYNEKNGLTVEDWRNRDGPEIPE